MCNKLNRRVGGGGGNEDAVVANISRKTEMEFGVNMERSPF